MQSLSNDQVRAVLGMARSARIRDWLMYLVAFWHGLRSSEVVQLTRDSVSNGYITVARLKGSLRTTQPLFESEDTLFNERAALEEFIAGLVNSNRIFPISREHYARLFHGYAVRAGIPRHLAHPHILKHSIAMQTIQSAGIENVRQYLGHKSISSTGAYLKVNDADASAAVARALRNPFSGLIV